MNSFEFFNDICVFLITQHFLLFTDIVPDSETQFLIGFSCIGLTALCILVNMALVMRNLCYFFKLVSKKYGKRVLKFYEPELNIIDGKIKAWKAKRRAA